jgi:hypothetical protein
MFFTRLEVTTIWIRPFNHPEFLALILNFVPSDLMLQQQQGRLTVFFFVGASVSAPSSSSSSLCCSR